MDPYITLYRLAPRGGGGLACDAEGVTLGPAPLLRYGERAEIAPLSTIDRVLGAAFGPQPPSVALRIRRGLERVARAMENGDYALAGVETVLFSLPDPSPSGLAMLAKVAKWGDYWQYQPRVPAGNPDGGEWTTGGPETPPPTSDTVHRPEQDAAVLRPAGGSEEEPPTRRSNGPPPDFTTLVDVFPGLAQSPATQVILAPVDGFLGLSALADDANAEATLAAYRGLVAQIQAIDPSFDSAALWPEGGVDGMSWQARSAMIDNLRMQLAATTYNTRGDIGLLQVETLRFLQARVDAAYEDAVANSDSGRLAPKLSREEAIGNFIDQSVRNALKEAYYQNGVSFGGQQNISINSRDYATTDSNNTYRVPDTRLGDVVMDWSLTAKSPSAAQIRGFFAADSRPQAVIIVRPSHFGPSSTYMITRSSVGKLETGYEPTR